VGLCEPHEVQQDKCKVLCLGWGNPPYQYELRTLGLDEAKLPVTIGPLRPISNHIKFIRIYEPHTGPLSVAVTGGSVSLYRLV